uniref:Zeatin O-glucosyltransferase n=1 Tax=Cajanus cajan TaxID=3821 RepID=A0A151QU88_CAJCA|nr:Zeatin O-glucosyltransferase [Cajanus cajan]
MNSDQPRKTVLVTQVPILVWLGGIAQRNTMGCASVVENCVRRLMETKEGDEIRARAMKLKIAIRRPKDEGGVSRKEVDSFITHITK